MASSSRDSIVQRIAIEGAQDILRQLQQLGDGGEKAAKQLQDAFNAVNSPLNNVSSVFGRLRASFQGVSQATAPLRQGFADLGDRMRELGTSLGTVADRIFPHFREVAALATGGVIAGFALLIKSAADAAAEVGITAQRVGLSIQDFQNFGNAAHTAGVESNTFANSMLQLSRQIQQAANNQTNALDGLAVALYGATTNTGTQVVGAAQKTQGKLISIASDASKEIAAIAQQPQVKLEQAGIHKSVAQITNDLNQARAATGSAGEAIRNFLRQALAPQKAQTLGEALGIDQLEQQLDPLSRLKVRVLDPLTLTIRDTRDVLFDLANAFQKLPDGPQKTATALQIFSQDGDRLITFLDKGSAGIRELGRQFANLGINIDKGGVAAGLRFKSALITLESFASGIKTLIGLAFAPAATQLIQAATEALVQNANSIIRWARNVAQDFQPVVDDFVTLLNNIGQAADQQQPLKTDFAKGFLETLKSIRDAVLFVAGAFKLLSAAIDVVLVPFNALFGTELTGPIVLITGLILSFTGVFGALGSVIAVVGTVIGLFVSALAGLPALFAALGVGVPAFVTAIAAAAGPIGVAIAALVGVLIALAANWKTVTDNANAFWTLLKALGEFLGRQFNTVVSAIGNAFQHAWDVAVYWTQYGVGLISQTLQALWDKIKAVGDALASVFGGASQATASLDVSGIPGQAGGGPVIGRGTSTSDSNLRRLSDGEYVVRAAAVRSVGLDFMNGLNALGGSFARIRGAFGGMANGGMVRALPDVGSFSFLPSMELAGVGGGAGGGIPVHLHFGGRSFELSGSPDIVESLKRAAAKENMLSAGRAPGWVGT